MGLNPIVEVISRKGRGTGATETAYMAPASWPALEERLTTGTAATWLSLCSEGRVHTRPVFAAWTGSSFVHASNPEAVKSALLESAGRCSLAFELPGTHLVVEAVPARLITTNDLERAQKAFADVYEWPVTVKGDLIDAPYAAPTSGGPPFRVYEFSPARAHAFPTNDDFQPTRFVF